MGHCAEEGAHLIIITSQAEQVRRRKGCFGGPWGQGKLMSLSPVESHADLHSVLHITYPLSWQVELVRIILCPDCKRFYLLVLQSDVPSLF